MTFWDVKNKRIKEKNVLKFFLLLNPKLIEELFNGSVIIVCQNAVIFVPANSIKNDF